jgi:hypothetical protein
LDLSHHPIGRQPPLDLFLRRHGDADIAFDDGLTRERVASGHVFSRQPQRATATDIATRDLHRTAATPPLPAARLSDLDARLMRGLGQQRARRHMNRLRRGVV